MRLLIIGGTRFLGHALTEAALRAGHTVTLLHRGTAGCAVLPEAEHLHAERDGGLEVLGDRTWDTVIDTCGQLPRVVEASATRLRPRAGRYLFISTISVYADPLPSGVTEDAPVATLADPRTEALSNETYGGLKALCESRVRAAFGAEALIVRPGLIVGPRDYTDRFPYWIRRLADGGEVLAPGNPEQRVQFIDARDLATFCLHLLDTGAGGTLHVTGPTAPLTMRAFLEGASTALGSHATFTWLDEAFLRETGVHPWTELPLWVPATDAAFSAVDLGRAVAAGLHCRPMADTVRDTLTWERALPDGARTGSPAMTREREADLLLRWRRRS